MDGVVQLVDGTHLDVVGRPTQGTRHHVVFCTDVDTGLDVVVKVELVADSLLAEHRALVWAAAHGARVPRVLRVSEAVSEDGMRAACLVIERVAGTAPVTEAAWRRMGVALADLARVPWTGADLLTFDPVAFGVLHRERVEHLGERLVSQMGRIADWDRLTSPQVPGAAPLVFTHGDPGAGNFLDDGRAGTLIDWEDGQIAPRGLDLARAIFIALLDAAQASSERGVIDQKLARAVADGYLGALDGAWRPTVPELRWWLTVAGVQFALRRWQRRGQPRVLPWADAINVLARALDHSCGWLPTEPAA